MIPVEDRRGLRSVRSADNDWTESATAAAAAESARQAAQRLHNPEHRAAAGWALAATPAPANAGLAVRARSDAGASAQTALNRTDLPAPVQQRLRTVVQRLGNALVDGTIDPHINQKFRQHLYDLATLKHDHPGFRGALAQFTSAAEALDRHPLARGTRLAYDPGADQKVLGRTGLPGFDVPSMDADIYFRTVDNTLHVESTKATPNGLRTEVGKAAALGDNSQLGRQALWEQAGTADEPRVLTHFHLDDGPGFNRLLEPAAFETLERVAGLGPDERRFVIGDRSYSLNELRQVRANAHAASEPVVEAERQRYGAADAFDPEKAREGFFRRQAATTEQAMKNFGPGLGAARTPLQPLEPAAVPSLKQGGLFGAAAAGGITLLRVGADGRLTAADAREVAGHTAFGAGVGVLTAAGERAVTPMIDRAAGAGIQRVATQTASRVSATVTAEAAAGFGVGARTALTRVAGSTAVGAVIATGVSAYENRQGLAKGDSQAIGNVTADATVAVGSIAAATAAGAAIGSVVPVAGTAVGAVVGLAVGVGVAYGAQISGARDAVANTVSGWVDGVKGWF